MIICSNFAIPSLILRTKLDEPPLFVGADENFRVSLMHD